MKTSFSLMLSNQRRQPVGAGPISTILAREVIEHLQTLRFILSAVILTALMIVSGLATSASYRQVWKQYDTNLNNQERGLRTLATLVDVVNFRFTATMPPDQWAFMIGAQQWELPHQVALTFLNRGEPTKVFTYPGQESASLLSWIQVVAFFVSFMAIILLFDAINGEGDTLKLILSNPVSRFQILAGKALAAYGVIGSSLLTGILCSVLVILVV
ncbi:MAG: ABC transporter permease subunit, partial [Candidatus Hadarchaeum sp.]